MRILLINVDSRWNMAIRKMYNYFRHDRRYKTPNLARIEFSLGVYRANGGR